MPGQLPGNAAAFDGRRHADVIDQNPSLLPSVRQHGEMAVDLGLEASRLGPVADCQDPGLSRTAQSVPRIG